MSSKSRDVNMIDPEWAPKSKQEAYKRLHYYVSKSGVAVSQLLQEALVNLRQNAHNLADEDLQKLALKGFSEDEFAPAVKELMCIWLHVQALEQGSERMPPWLLTFLRLAFGASDYVLPHPKAQEVLSKYEDTSDLTALALQCSIKVASLLGFGDAAETFAPVFSPIVLQTNSSRYQILHDALTLPLDVVINESFG